MQESFSCVTYNIVLLIQAYCNMRRQSMAIYPRENICHIIISITVMAAICPVIGTQNTVPFKAKWKVFWGIMQSTMQGIIHLVLDTGLIIC